MWSFFSPNTSEVIAPSLSRPPVVTSNPQPMRALPSKSSRPTRSLEFSRAPGVTVTSSSPLSALTASHRTLQRNERAQRVCSAYKRTRPHRTSVERRMRGPAQDCTWLECFIQTNRARPNALHIRVN